VKAPILLTSILIAALAFTTACNGDDGPTDAELQQGLQSMVLRPDEVPEGLQSIRSEFADNDQAASGLGGGPTKEQLEAWGRILGYSSDFQTADPNPATFTTALSSQVTLYDDAPGAAQSFTDRLARARAADWQGSHIDLAEFQQEQLTRDLPVDDSFWIHLTGYQATSSTERRLVSDDIVIFRVGRAWGYLNAVSLGAASVSDRAFAEDTVEALLLEQIAHTRNGLESGLLD
jgi:hypothetical protein